MGSVQIVTTILAAAITAVAVWLAVRAVLKMMAVIRLGQPDPERFTDKGARAKTMLVETAGHTRMLKWGVVGAAHWFVMVAFIVLSLLVLEAYFEVVSPDRRAAADRAAGRSTAWSPRSSACWAWSASWC